MIAHRGPGWRTLSGGAVALWHRLTMETWMVNGGGLRRAGVALLALLLAAAAGAQTRAYVLDPQHSWVQFELLHFGTSTIRGRLGPANGVVNLDRAAAAGDISVVVDTASVSTGLPVFDARIRRADLLATDEYPQAWFVARQLRLDARGGVASVRGELSLRGASLALSLEAERFSCRQDEGRERCGGDFVGRISRREAGIDFGAPFVGDEVVLRIQVEALHQPP
jgi:polyisoprenoid-binding protein YceI